MALRVGRPEQQGLVARRLTTVVERPYAHRRWLEARGVDPECPDLSEHEVLVVLGDRWNAPDAVPVLRSTSLNVLYRACRLGHGVALLPDVMAGQSPNMVALAGPERRTDVWMVMHPDVARIERVRVVADLIARRMSARGG